MSRLSQEVASLLWEVVDSADPGAESEFLRRYPNLAHELEDRRRMADALRRSRPIAGRPKPLLARDKRRSPVQWGLVAAVVCTSLLALAAYDFLRRTTLATPQTLQQGRPPGVDKEDAGRAKVIRKFGRKSSRKGNRDEEIKASQGGDTGSATPPGGTEDYQKGPLNRTITLHQEDVSLKTVIETVAAQSGLILEVAPGFEDMRVNVDYDGVPALEVLDDLGQNFGFSALPQSDNRVLLIPVVDSGRPPLDLGRRGRSEPSPSLPAPGSGD